MAVIAKRRVVGNRSLPEPHLSLSGADGLAALPASLDGIEAITLRFDSYRDGRGYSVARLLREQFGFAGELRATGDILPDQVRELERVGFDSIEIDDAHAKAVLTCAGIVTVHTQPALDD